MGLNREKPEREAMSIAIGYMPGAFGEGGSDHDYLRKLVEVGDKYDYDSLWLSDRIVGEKFSRGWPGYHKRITRRLIGRELAVTWIEL